MADEHARGLQTADLDGLSVRYLDIGEGPPLLLVHGFLVSHLEWEAILPLLTPHFRCIVPDLPGFGKSAKPRQTLYPYSAEAFADTLAQLLTHLGIDKAHVCGHSMGGGISITFASMYAERVERLTLIDSACYPFDLPLKARIPTIPVLGPMVFRHIYRRPIFRDYFKNDVFGGSDACNLDRVDAYYDDFSSHDGREAAWSTFQGCILDLSPIASRVVRIQAPTLVVWGSDDRIFPRSLAQRLATEIPDSRLEILQGCGHAPNEEMPDALAPLLIGHHLSPSQ